MNLPLVSIVLIVVGALLLYYGIRFPRPEVHDSTPPDGALASPSVVSPSVVSPSVVSHPVDVAGGR